MKNNKKSSIEKDFVSYDEALTLKELGFNEPCHRGWDEDYKIWYHPDSSIVVDNPTFSQAFRWFREKHGICGNVSPIEDGSAFYHMIYTNINVPYSNRICTLPEKWETYEEAELACLKKLIEIAKSKKP